MEEKDDRERDKPRDPTASNHREPRPEGEEDDERLRDRLQGLIPDIVKRAVTAGIGAVTGEESLRKMAGELPKDVAAYLVAQASSSKEELYRIIGRELREWLDRLNLHEEMVKVLTAVSFEIKTEVRLIPNEAGTGIKPDVKRKVTVKRAGGKEPKPGEE